MQQCTVNTNIYIVITLNFNIFYNTKVVKYFVKMHLDKQKPRFQIRVLEYEKDGVTFKKSRNSNIYPNSDNLTFDKLWKLLKKVIENGK